MVEASDVVEAADVVCVVVGVEDGVDAIDVIGEALQAQFGGGVDEQVQVTAMEPDAGAGAVVTRVGGRTDGAATTDHGDAMRSSAAEDDDVHSAHVVPTLQCANRAFVKGESYGGARGRESISVQDSDFHSIRMV